MKTQNAKPPSKARLAKGGKTQYSKSGGFGLIDIIISVAIVGVALFGVSQIAVLGFRYMREASTKQQAIFLTEEAIEAARFLRDQSWAGNISNLNLGVDYYPIASGTTWFFSPTDPGLINGKFTRTIRFDRVFRNASDDITATGTEDLNTRMVTARVLWGETTANALEFTGGDTDGLPGFAFPANSGWGDPAQSFTNLPRQVSLRRVDLHLRKDPANPSPSNIFLEFRDGTLAGGPGSLLSTSQTVVALNLPTVATWITFEFPSAVTLSPSGVYYLRLRSTPDSTIPFSGATQGIHWRYLHAASSYAGGDAWRFVGTGAQQRLGPLDQYDFNFRLYEQVTGAKIYELVTYLTNFLFN